MENQKIQSIQATDNKNPFKIATIVLSIIALGLAGLAVFLMVKTSDLDGKYNTLLNERGSEEKNLTSEYKIGDKISFNGESWHVIADSDSSKDYIVALKDTTIPQLDGEPFYECPKEYDNGINCSMRMTNDYALSTPKKFFDDIYIDQLGRNNLKNIDGYYVRLITLDELVTLGCSRSEMDCDNAPDWLVSRGFWTMTYPGGKVETDTTASGGASIYTFDANRTIGNTGVGSTVNVRPVINLLKASIE